MHPEDTAIRLFQKLRQTLQTYADHHLAKNPPQPEKAAVNTNLVHEINGALIALATPGVLTLTDELVEAVRQSDNLAPGRLLFHPSDPQHIPSIPHLVKFVEALATRDDEDCVAVRMRLADLRALAGVDEG